jgi:hypothetical protein
MVAKEEKYDMLLTDGVAYYGEEFDATDKVEGKLGTGGGSKAPKSKIDE